MKKINRIILAVMAMLIFTNSVFAQDHVEMADTMRAEGKIYVVVAIILIILLGFFAYMFLLDRKLSNLEKLLNKKGPKGN